MSVYKGKRDRIHLRMEHRTALRIKLLCSRNKINVNDAITLFIRDHWADFEASINKQMELFDHG